MKAFEEWYKKESRCPYHWAKGNAYDGWKAALEWILTWENDPESIEVIERELGNESI